MRVLVVMDSFKGSLDAPLVAAAIAEGWKSVHPSDDVVELAMGDGGEGTAAVIASAVEGAVLRSVPGVAGPDGRPTPGEWFALPGGVAVLDLAQMSGLPLMKALSPMDATTRGLGETMKAALREGAVEIWICLGGSASTDAGVGALQALGMEVHDRHGRIVPVGGIGLSDAASIDTSGLIPVPGGVTLVTDVTSPLTGPHGAAAIYGPQKGASPEDVHILDAALERFADVCGLDPYLEGTGAAGGTAYGFAFAYGAHIVSGADRVADVIELDAQISAADLVITGEGSYDDQSRRGKVVGNILDRAQNTSTPSAVIAGRILDDPGVPHISLVELAGNAAEALRQPAKWAEAAGAHLARALRRVE